VLTNSKLQIIVTYAYWQSYNRPYETITKSGQSHRPLSYSMYQRYSSSSNQVLITSSLLFLVHCIHFKYKLGLITFRFQISISFQDIRKFQGHLDVKV